MTNEEQIINLEEELEDAKNEIDALKEMLEVVQDERAEFYTALDESYHIIKNVI